MPRKPKIDPVLQQPSGVVLEYEDGRTETLPEGAELPQAPEGMGWQQVIGVGEGPRVAYRLQPLGEPGGVPGGDQAAPPPAEPAIPPPRTEMEDGAMPSEPAPEGITPAGFMQWLMRGAKQPDAPHAKPPATPEPRAPDVQLPLGREPSPDPKAAPIEVMPGVRLNTSPMQPAEIMTFLDNLGLRMADQSIPPPRLFELNSRRYLPEDLRLWADAVLDANEKLVEAAIRANISREQLVERVVKVGLDNYAIRLLRRKPDEALNAEEMIGATLVVLAQHQNTMTAMRRYMTRGTDEAGLDFARHLTMFSTLTAQLRGAVGEAGRALNAWQFASAALDLADAYDRAMQAVLARRGVGVAGAQQAQAAQAVGNVARNPPSGPPAGPQPQLGLRVGPQDRMVPRAPEMEGAGGPTYDPQGFIREAVEAMGGHEHLRLLALLFASVPQDVATRVASQGVLGKTRDMVLSMFLNGLLSSPPTHIVNFVGSNLYGVMNAVERGMASGTRVVREALGDMAEWIAPGNTWASSQRVAIADELGNKQVVEVPREGVSAMEMAAMAEGAANAIWDAIRAGARAFSEGRSAWVQNKLDIHGGESPLKWTAENVGIRDGTMGAAMFNLLGLAIEWPARLIIATDDFTRTLWRNAELYAQVERQVARAWALGAVKTKEEAEQLRLMLRETPPPAMAEAADAFAASVAFQQTFASPTGRALATIMQHPAMKPIVPFYSTPTNIVLATLERSPFAAMLPRFWQELRAGGARADLALTKFIVGTGTFFMLAHQIAGLLAEPERDALITGGRPEGAAGQTFDRLGLQPYSLCFKDGGEWRCHSYMRVDPLSAVVAMAADTAWTMARGPGQMTVDDDVSAIEMAFGAAVGLYDYMLEQPMLQGLTEIVDLLGLRRGASGERAVENVGPALEKIAANFMAAMVPSSAMFGAVQRTVDPTVYVTRQPGPVDELNAKMQEDVRVALHVHRMAMEQFKARFPGGWDDRVPARNIYGEIVERDDFGLPPLFYPWRMTRGQDSEVDALLLRVAARGGYAGMQLPDWKWPNTGIRITNVQRDYLIAAAASDIPALSGSNLTLREEFERVFSQYKTRLDALNDVVKSLPHGNERTYYLQELWRLESDIARELGEIYSSRLAAARDSLVNPAPSMAVWREMLGFSDERLEVDRLRRLVEAAEFYRDVHGRAPQSGRDLGRVNLLRDAPMSMREGAQ